MFCTRIAFGAKTCRRLIQMLSQCPLSRDVDNISLKPTANPEWRVFYLPKDFFGKFTDLRQLSWIFRNSDTDLWTPRRKLTDLWKLNNSATLNILKKRKLRRFFAKLKMSNPKFCKIWVRIGAQVGRAANVCKSCRYWNMLQNNDLLSNMDSDTAANGLRQVCCMIRAREPWVGFVYVSIATIC